MAPAVQTIGLHHATCWYSSPPQTYLFAPRHRERQKRDRQLETSCRYVSIATQPVDLRTLTNYNEQRWTCFSGFSSPEIVDPLDRLLVIFDDVSFNTNAWYVSVSMLCRGFLQVGVLLAHWHVDIIILSKEICMISPTKNFSYFSVFLFGYPTIYSGLL
jgi:hypothetical protein